MLKGLLGGTGIANDDENRDEKWERYDYRLAHHPICDKFNDHVYHLFGKKWCRGCVMMYLGYIIGVPVIGSIFFFTNISIPVHHGLMWAIILPTLISAYTKPRRWIRDITRFLLGVGVIYALGVILVGIFLGYYVIPIFVLASYIFLSRKLVDKRAESNKKVCKSCEEFENPRCPGFESYYDRKMIRESGTVRLDVLAE